MLIFTTGAVVSLSKIVQKKRKLNKLESKQCPRKRISSSGLWVNVLVVSLSILSKRCD